MLGNISRSHPTIFCILRPRTYRCPNSTFFEVKQRLGHAKTQRLTIDMRIDASQVTPMVMSSAEHHLTHSQHTTTRRVQFSTCIKICLMKSCTTFSLQNHALQVLNLHLPPTSRPSHMFCSKAFICKLQQETGLSNSSISNLFAQLMSKSSMRHVSLGSIGHVGI